ncbi:ABC transporter substrate-binding protein [Cohnella fermenti]|uniref:Extracellular solute-binding protein n=1 Tax=Cohnella fermenti TaxID=2565925 RepID=A0A4S4BP17_9BACL|nr:extracellular solute-binding protein [Cohnella fermenti]THF76087.1 extracellular solute-binding protein [Cohnella fermenti]
MKKVTSFVAALALSAVALTACGSDNTASNTASPSSGGTAGASPSASTSPKNVALGISVPGQDLPGLEELAKKFEEQNAGVKISVARAPNEQYEQTLKAHLVAKEDVPDLFLQWPGRGKIGVAINAGYLADLSSLGPVADIDQGQLSPFSQDGKVYGIPWAKNFLGVYYNKTLFEQQGLNVPTNWEELLEVADRLQSAGVTPFAFPAKDGSGMFTWYALVPSTVYAKDPDWDQKRYDNQVQFATSDSWKSTGEQLKLLLDKGYLGKNINGLGNDSANALIADGKAAMIVNGNWAIGDYEKLASDAGITMGMFAFPGNEPGQPLWLSAAPSTGLSVWSGSPNQDTAKQLIEFLYDEENVPALIGSGQFSTLKTVAMDSNPIFADILDIIRTGSSYPFLDVGWPAGPQSDAFTKETQAALGGASTFEKVLEAADKSWDKSVESGN